MKRIFYMFFVLCLIGILIVSILHPQNNLVPGRIFLYMLVWVFLLLSFCFFLYFLEKKLIRKGIDLQRISNFAEIVFILIYGAVLYYISLILRSDPVTDYKAVYDTATMLAAGQSSANWDYFSMWTNNLGALTILTACMKMGNLLGFHDVYYFVLAVNVLQIMICMKCISYLTGSFFPNKCFIRWFSIGLLAMWTPIWSSANAFYSDQLSFSGSIIAFTLWVYSAQKHQNTGWKKWLCITCAGFLWALASCAKATAAISFVAFVILWLWDFGKKGFKEYIWLCLIFFVTIQGFHFIEAGYPSVENEYRLKMPVEYWIAMGLEGNGTYAENSDLVQICFSSSNVDERRDNCRTIIKNKWKNIYDAEHVYRKISANFASGDIQPTSLTYPMRDSVLWHCFDTEGKYYWKYTCTSTGFFYAIMFIMIFGGFFQVIMYKPDDFMFLCYMTIFGLFLFLMIWEAQNKQIFNHIPWITMAVTCVINRLESMISESRKIK